MYINSRLIKSEQTALIQEILYSVELVFLYSILLQYYLYASTISNI